MNCVLNFIYDQFYIEQLYVPYISFVLQLIYIILVCLYHYEYRVEMYYGQLNWVQSIYNMFGLYILESVQRLPQIINWFLIVPQIEMFQGHFYLLLSLFCSYCIFFMYNGSSLNHDSSEGVCQDSITPRCCGSWNYSFFAGIYYAVILSRYKYTLSNIVMNLSYGFVIVWSIVSDFNTVNEYCFSFDWHVMWILEGFIFASLVILFSKENTSGILSDTYNYIFLIFNFIISVCLFITFINISNLF